MLLYTKMSLLYMQSQIKLGEKLHEINQTEICLWLEYFSLHKSDVHFIMVADQGEIDTLLTCNK